jgi:hypothetical protein
VNVRGYVKIIMMLNAGMAGLEWLYSLAEPVVEANIEYCRPLEDYGL